MSFIKPIQDYKRSPVPALPGSQQKWLEEELKKLERTLQSVSEALRELEARVSDLESP